MNYYHGTNLGDFKILTPNDFGVIWLTDDLTAARKYATKYYNKSTPRVFHVKIQGEILNFLDKENPIVKEYIKDIQFQYLINLFENWESIAAFDILERNSYLIEELKIKGYSGIELLDSTYGYNHKSIAYFNDLEIIDIEYL